MTRLLFVFLTFFQFGCKDTPQTVDTTETVKADTASSQNIIRLVRQQTLHYLDTIIGNKNKILVRFHSKLDSSTFQTLQNWIFHNESKIHVSDKDFLDQLNKSYVDSLMLSQYDTTFLASASNENKITQIHFNGFAHNSDTTKIATVIGVYFGDEGERITGWKEFLVFSRQESSYTIAKRGIVTEY